MSYLYSPTRNTENWQALNPGTASFAVLFPTVPWKNLFLEACWADKELSKSVSDSVKHFTECSGMDQLAHRDSITFLHITECCVWICPWNAMALDGIVSSLGMMSDNYSAVPAWLCRDLPLFVSRRLTFESKSAGRCFATSSQIPHLILQ